jgi:hypothetical protein
VSDVVQHVSVCSCRAWQTVFGFGAKIRLEFSWEQKVACGIIVKIVSRQTKVVKRLWSSKCTNEGLGHLPLETSKIKLGMCNRICK